MYLNAYEIERNLKTSTNFRHERHLTELDLQKLELQRPVDRLRLRLSNVLMDIAKMIRPADSSHRKVASA